MSKQSRHAQSFARNSDILTSSACRWNIRTCARFEQNLKPINNLRMSMEYSEPKFVDHDGRADATSLGADPSGLPTAPIVIQEPIVTPRELPPIASIRSL